MSPKLFGPRTAGTFSDIQHHAIRGAPPLTGKPALFVAWESSNQRLRHQRERPRVLPSPQFLEVAHAQECKMCTGGHHQIPASRCLFLLLEACSWKPLRLPGNFASFF